jgi:hypothetical protein
VFDQTVRVVFSTTEQNCDFNLYLDFEYSAKLWAGFKQLKHADFKIDGQAVRINKDEICEISLNTLTAAFINELTPAI